MHASDRTVLDLIGSQYITGIGKSVLNIYVLSKQVSSPQKFWGYTFNALLSNLYTDKWYNGKDINWREALQIDDRNTIRVGVARFRQLRIKEGE